MQGALLKVSRELELLILKIYYWLSWKTISECQQCQKEILDSTESLVSLEERSHSTKVKKKVKSLPGFSANFWSLLDLGYLSFCLYGKESSTPPWTYGSREGCCLGILDHMCPNCYFHVFVAFCLDVLIIIKKDKMIFCYLYAITILYILHVAQGSSSSLSVAQARQ